MDSFNKKCDDVLLYLKKHSSGQRTDVIFPIALKKLEEDTGVTFSSDVLNFLINDKKFVERHYSSNSQHFTLTSLGMAFISHSSFVKEQEKIDNEVTLKWYQTENAKQIFDDYPLVKKKANWALAISIILALAAVIKLVVFKS